MRIVTGCRRDGSDVLPALCRDRGSVSLTLVLLTPIVTVLMFAGVQTALWNHARAEARAVARATAAMVGRGGATPSEAQHSAEAALAGTSLAGAVVTVRSGGGLVSVTVAGDAAGFLRGISRHVAVTEQVPIEGWVPL